MYKRYAEQIIVLGKGFKLPVEIGYATRGYPPPNPGIRQSPGACLAWPEGK